MKKSAACMTALLMSAVLARGERSFKGAQPGKALDWSVEAEITKPGTEAKCVLGASVL